MTFIKIAQELLNKVTTLYLEQGLTQKQVREALGLTEHQFKQVKKAGGFQKIAPKQFKEKILQDTPIEVIAGYYQDHSFNETREHFCISEQNLKEIVRDYQLYHTSEQKVKCRQRTCLDRYGKACVLSTEWSQAKSHAPDTIIRGQETARQRRLEKYGVEYTWQIPGVKEKARQTNLERYGAPTWSATEEGRAYTSALHSDPKYQARTNASKKKNKSFNTSKPEEDLLALLGQIFGEEDITRQYRDPVRYPFNCDFYIKSLDLFIELNIHWTHGKVPYVEDDPQCAAKLNKWKEKANTSKFYKLAIKTWTDRDVSKLQIAQKNKLNYLVIYSKRDVVYLGANGVMDALRKQFLALPESKKKKEDQNIEE